MAEKEDKTNASGESAGASLPPTVAVIKTVLGIGVSAADIGILKPGEFACTLGVALRTFSEIASAKTGVPREEMSAALKADFDRGFATPVEHMEADATDGIDPATLQSCGKSVH